MDWAWFSVKQATGSESYSQKVRRTRTLYSNRFTLRQTTQYIFTTFKLWYYIYILLSISYSYWVKVKQLKMKSCMTLCERNHRWAGKQLEQTTTHWMHGWSVARSRTPTPPLDTHNPPPSRTPIFCLASWSIQRPSIQCKYLNIDKLVLVVFGQS